LLGVIELKVKEKKGGEAKERKIKKKKQKLFAISLQMPNIGAATM
jgi:hypothetical protein